MLLIFDYYGMIDELQDISAAAADLIPDCGQEKTAKNGRTPEPVRAGPAPCVTRKEECLDAHAMPGLSVVQLPDRVKALSFLQ